MYSLLLGSGVVRRFMSDNVVVFDLETQREFAEVGGREHTEKLGVSVGVAYHMGENRFYHFEERQMPQLVALLQRADLVVGFNIRSFDFKVLSAYTNEKLYDLPNCDMLVDVQEALGFRIKLDSLSQQTLGLQKSADGTLALKWWREGKIDLIRDYCQQDVDVTRRLWEYGRDHGHIWYYDSRQSRRHPIPVRWGVPIKE